MRLLRGMHKTLQINIAMQPLWPSLSAKQVAAEISDFRVLKCHQNMSVANKSEKFYCFSTYAITPSYRQKKKKTKWQEYDIKYSIIIAIRDKQRSTKTLKKTFYLLLKPSQNYNSLLQQ